MNRMLRLALLVGANRRLRRHAGLVFRDIAHMAGARYGLRRSPRRRRFGGVMLTALAAVCMAWLARRR